MLRPKLTGTLTVLVALLFTACAESGTAQAPVMQSREHSFRVVTVAEGLDHPWSIAFLPGGDMLVTERSGQLRIIRNGALLPEPVAGVPAVRARGQGGLLDVVLHPNFATNRLVYLSFSKPNAEGNQSTTAVVRGRFEGDRLTNVQEVFEAKVWGTGTGHYGSRIAFDPRGFMFITVGDRQSPPQRNQESHPAQLLATHHGKVIRLYDDGRVPADNPFVGRQDALPEIWSYGHRNLQGLAINQQTGDVWQTEHGPQGGDELNLVRRERNYGWPIIGFGVNYGGAKLHESTAREGLEQPVHYWVPSIGTSGLMLYTGDKFPRWRGNLFAGGMAIPLIARVTLDGQRATGEEKFFQGQGRIRDIKQSPDGFIYVVIDATGAGSRSVVRLEPAG